MSTNENVDDGGAIPSPEEINEIIKGEIITLAQSVGYEERRPTVSYTLFFIEKDPAHDMPPCRINVYYTTRSIMTHLNHPPTGRTNELWRSNAYDNLEELRAFFLNPRIHTGKGYRNAKKAVRGCVGCGEMKNRTGFSKNQWIIKGPDANKCIDCLGESNGVSDLTSGLENVKLEEADPTNFPALTQDLLQTHDKAITGDTATIKNDMVRRQFNCPDCPRHGRGEFVFFKKVPALKPIVKCPQCKKASRGKCKRLYPIPKEAEKGYGLYKCAICSDKWGSSRAVANIGQECFSCANKGIEGAFVTPFRLEKHKNKKPGAGRGMKRVPKEPIGEDDADEREYGDADRERNDSSWENVGGGGDAGERSYDVEPRGADDYANDYGNEPIGAVEAPTRIPAGYKHKCAGCSSGACKNRKIPKSETHDNSDGNTVSTSASAVTNSSIDKTDFVDRDEDFSGFDSEWIDV
mmetsp:Transcript_23211/g.38427  ORF Transcript_23211/g.38427 Transcript_23211/m.38427 type:complete len:464 (+) Transcript_23211:59-1450(+)